MDGFDKKVIERLPLADAVMSLLAWVTEENFLEQVFESYRGRSYNKSITFASLLRLISDALIEHEGCAHQSMLHMSEEEFVASQQAFYGKLRRLPVSLSCGLLARATDRLIEVFPEAIAQRLPMSLTDFDVIAVDGKKIKNAAKRLKAAREFSGTPLGGKGLVAFRVETGMILSMSADLDGERNDAPLVPGLLPQVREQCQKPILYLADRQFCDLIQPPQFAECGHHYLLRYHPKTTFYPDPNTPSREGFDTQGRRYIEDEGTLGSPAKKRSIPMRRVTLFREGEEDIILVTNLLDADRYPASDLLEAYLMRWGIERVFQKVTEVFHLKRLISSSPQGTIFQCSFCLLLYNVIQVVTAYLAEAQEIPTEEISTEKLFKDVHREMISLSVLTHPESIEAYFQPAADQATLMEHLRWLLSQAWQETWLKSPKKKITPPKPKRPIAGGHTSIYRILQSARNKPKDKDV